MYTAIKSECTVQSFSQAINGALAQAMGADPSVICYGLGVDDPKGVFGTTLGLKEKFGSLRVFDMPTSENAMTGVGIGAALSGLRPVMNHQRLDFFLLAMDQLVNNAAKWFYMYGGRRSVPLTVRLVLGRGWGQGATHSQHLQAWFAHIPGLKVVMPATPNDAKGLLLSSIFDDNPVIFLEHRWLYEQRGHVAKGDSRVPLGQARCLEKGKDLTIVAYSFMAIEALKAVRFLKEYGITCDLIDLRTIKPLDWKTVFSSVQKTGRLLAVDHASPFCSVSSEIVSRVAMDCFNDLTQAPMRITLPDAPTPTSPALSKYFYKRASDIVTAATKMMNCPLSIDRLQRLDSIPHDVPGEWFKGPF